MKRSVKADCKLCGKCVAELICATDDQVRGATKIVAYVFRLHAEREHGSIVSVADSTNYVVVNEYCP